MSFLFGLCFIGHTGALTNEVCTPIDPTHWVWTTPSPGKMPDTVVEVLGVGDKFQDLTAVRDICLFLNNPTQLAPDQALCLYIKSGNDWSYRGFISANRVSEVFPLQVGSHSAFPYPRKINYLWISENSGTVILQKETFWTAK